VAGLRGHLGARRGFWLCLVALPNQVVSAVPAARAGSATAVNTVVRNAGGALGVQLAAPIIVSSARAGRGVPAASGYIGALILCATATCADAFVAIAARSMAVSSAKRVSGSPKITSPASIASGASGPIISARRLGW